MACDGDYLYTYSEYGFHKIGTGFGGTVSGHPYVSVARTFSLTVHSSDVCLGFYQVSSIICLFNRIDINFFFYLTVSRKCCILEYIIRTKLAARKLSF